jgi:hypothetical protein
LHTKWKFREMLKFNVNIEKWNEFNSDVFHGLKLSTAATGTGVKHLSRSGENERHTFNVVFLMSCGA